MVKSTTLNRLKRDHADRQNFWDAVQTGYFGRAKDDGHDARNSRVHLVYTYGDQPICGYRPHQTMRFQFCAAYPHYPYVECPACKALYEPPPPPVPTAIKPAKKRHSG